MKTEGSWIKCMRMTQNDQYYMDRDAQNENRFQQEGICPPLSSASCVKNKTFGTWHNCDGSASSCQKPSSLLRNLAFSLRQKERALSTSWKHLLTAIKAACGGKTDRKMQSYQTECHTWQEHGRGGGGGCFYGGVYTVDNGITMLN